MEDAANEKVLERMRSQGDNLTRPRDVDFTVVFPTEAAAHQFAEHLRALRYKVTVSFSETAEGQPWDVCVVRHMVPSNSAITEFERELQEVADPLSGRNDGWGCISDPSVH